MDSMLFLKKQSVMPPAGNRLIKADDYGQMIAANEILDAVHEKATETMAQAREIFESKKKQGYEDGLEEGRMEHLEKIMDTSMKAIDYFESMEKSIAALVTQCLEKILGEMDNDDLILRVVRSGLAIARNEQRVVVRVCPADLKAVQGANSILLQAYPGISVLDITEDPRLKRGACIVESELGVVDASLETQVAAVKRAIAKRI